jgi:hypothetical protein
VPLNHFRPFICSNLSITSQFLAWRRICVRLTARRRRLSSSSLGLPKSLPAQTSTLVRHGRQQKKDHPVSLIGGSRSTGFRAVHDDRPFGCRDGPPPCPTTPAQEHIKNRKLIWLRHRPAPPIPSVISHIVRRFKSRERQRHYPNVSSKNFNSSLKASSPSALGDPECLLVQTKLLSLSTALISLLRPGR